MSVMAPGAVWCFEGGGLLYTRCAGLGVGAGFQLQLDPGRSRSQPRPRIAPSRGVSLEASIARVFPGASSMSVSSSTAGLQAAVQGELSIAMVPK